MRNFAKAALSVAVLAVAASVCFAQGGRGRGGPQTPEGPLLLGNKSVQDELKLTDDQKKDIKTVTDAVREKMMKAFQDAGQDQEARTKAMKEINDDANKTLQKTLDGLKEDQKKRFKQISVQVKGIDAFVAEDVSKALKLTDKQVEDFKTQATDFKKDAATLRMDAGRDADKRAEATKKIAELQAKVTDKILGTLSDDQKKSWKEMTGDKFDFKPDMPAGRGGAKADKSF
jgi:Spy/CpxP family protein refolding chaperone